MSHLLLVLNAGSSSLKFAFYQRLGAELQLWRRGQIEMLPLQPRWLLEDAVGTELERQQLIGVHDHGGAIDALLAAVTRLAQGRELLAVGHRVVHGGTEHASPVRIDDRVLSSLSALIALAPLHQPHNLAAIRRIAEAHPQLPQVACFDTAFHRSQAELVQRYALPEALFQQGVRRYGFHGLSYQWISSVLGQYDRRAAAGRTIVLHLGNGASLCALDQGLSVATSMGFSTLDGIPMASRCGQLDPGVMLYLLRQGMDLPALEKLLYHQSGLLGVSGESGDMRTLSASDRPGAKRAIELFVYRIVREIGSLAAGLGGLDALVFTAGIGEHAVELRAAVLQQLGWLGVRLDAVANQQQGPRISTLESAVSVWVIPTDEERVIAAQTLAVIDGGQ